MAFTSGIGAGTAEEDDDEHPYHIERGEKCREQRDPKNRCVSFVRESKDCILAKKTAEWWAADQRQCADEESDKGDRQFSGEPSHFPNVLFVMQHHDHRADT